MEERPVPSTTEVYKRLNRLRKKSIKRSPKPFLSSQTFWEAGHQLFFVWQAFPRAIILFLLFFLPVGHFYLQKESFCLPAADSKHWASFQDLPLIDIRLYP